MGLYRVNCIACSGCDNLIAPGDLVTIRSTSIYHGITAEGQPDFEEAVPGEGSFLCNDCAKASEVEAADDSPSAYVSEAIQRVMDATASIRFPFGDQPVSYDDEKDLDWPGPSACCRGCDYLCGALGSDE